MDYLAFRKKAQNYPLFKVEDVFKWFPKANRKGTLNQLNLWVKKGYLERISKGIYRLAEAEISDPFILASFLYGPSYITLESALNAYGIIPDIPFSTTSVALPKTKIFRTKNNGSFFYHHAKPGLFFGFHTASTPSSAYHHYAYRIATPEKALFDYFYFRAKKVKNAAAFLEEMRLSLPKTFRADQLRKWSKLVSPKMKTFHALILALTQKHVK